MLKAGAEIGMSPAEMDHKVDQWLDGQGNNICPWPNKGHGYVCSDYSAICRAMFPFVDVYERYTPCPCTQFSLSYVRRRAREALEG